MLDRLHRSPCFQPIFIGVTMLQMIVWQWVICGKVCWSLSIHLYHVSRNMSWVTGNGSRCAWKLPGPAISGCSGQELISHRRSVWIVSVCRDPSLGGLADATRLDISGGVWACRHTMFWHYAGAPMLPLVFSSLEWEDDWCSSNSIYSHPVFA